MRGFLVTLRATTALAFAGLLVGALIASFGVSIFFALVDGASWRAVVTAPLFALFVYPFALGWGILPALFVCVPLYALVRHFNRDSYVAAAAVATVPAAALLAFGPREMSGLFAWYGLVVGVCTHHVARTAAALAMRSNNSFKPKPLRGSA